MRLSAVSGVRLYARDLLATQFENAATDAALNGEPRNAARYFVKCCLDEWSHSPKHFKGGEDALSDAFKAQTIPTGPTNFPYLDHLHWTLREPPSDVDYD